ncbi:hypothetical protein QE152_g39527 [Popillia japonica]|uniref:Uncharacterized protein n=1 Tax=Popillia japonica TaxID=7064 RepID=A0AAW1HTU9_POPJA
MPPITRKKVVNKTSPHKLSTNPTKPFSSPHKLSTNPTKPFSSQSHKANDTFNNSPNLSSIQNSLNNSYITMVSDNEKLDNTEIEMVSDLRNRLAQSEYEMNELKDEKTNLMNRIQDLNCRLAGKQTIIDHLHVTISKLTSKLDNKNYVTNVETQTDFETKYGDGTWRDVATQHSVVQFTSESVQADIFEPPETNSKSHSCDHRLTLERPASRKTPRILLLGDSQFRGMAQIAILGDSQFRGMAQIAMNIFGTAYSVQSLFKPNAWLSLKNLHLVKNVKRVSRVPGQKWAAAVGSQSAGTEVGGGCRLCFPSRRALSIDSPQLGHFSPKRGGQHQGIPLNGEGSTRGFL